MEPVPLVERVNRFVLGIDDHGIDRKCVARRYDPVQGVCQQMLSQSSPLVIGTDGEPAENGGGDGIVGQALGQLRRQVVAPEGCGAQSVVAGNFAFRGPQSNEDLRDSSFCVLAGALPEIFVKGGLAAGKAAPVMVSAERLDDGRLWSGHLTSSALTIPPESSFKVLIGFGRVEQGVVKHLPIWIG